MSGMQLMRKEKLPQTTTTCLLSVNNSWTAVARDDGDGGDGSFHLGLIRLAPPGIRSLPFVPARDYRPIGTIFVGAS